MKYIVIANSFPIIFPEQLVHREVAGDFIHKVSSAGFVGFDSQSQSFKCSGESISLHIGSKPDQDRALLMKMFYPFG